MISNDWIAIVSIASVAGGAAVSCFADSLPMSRQRAELLGGAMLVFGLVLIGIGLAPIARG